MTAVSQLSVRLDGDGSEVPDSLLAGWCLSGQPVSYDDRVAAFAESRGLNRVGDFGYCPCRLLRNATRGFPCKGMENRCLAMPDYDAGIMDHTEWFSLGKGSEQRYLVLTQPYDAPESVVESSTYRFLVSMGVRAHLCDEVPYDREDLGGLVAVLFEGVPRWQRRLWKS